MHTQRKTNIKNTYLLELINEEKLTKTLKHTSNNKHLTICTHNRIEMNQIKRTNQSKYVIPNTLTNRERYTKTYQKIEGQVCKQILIHKLIWKHNSRKSKIHTNPTKGLQ